METLPNTVNVSRFFSLTGDSVSMTIGSTLGFEETKRTTLTRGVRPVSFCGSSRFESGWGLKGGVGGDRGWSEGEVSKSVRQFVSIT